MKLKLIIILLLLTETIFGGSKKLPAKIRNSIGMEFVYIKPGSFMIGSPYSEKGRLQNEAHFKVTLTKGFYMQTTEVTELQYKKIMKRNPSEFKMGDNYPVENVSWNDTQKFLKLLNSREKTNRYRLPTEAEWEYSCRAGTKTPFSFGNCINQKQVVYYGESYMDCPPIKETPKWPRKKPVGEVMPNRWGLYNMHGNVSEWCLDYYGFITDKDRLKQDKLKSLPRNYIPYKKHRIDYFNNVKSDFRMIRGGDFTFVAYFCRSASKMSFKPSWREYTLGFRIVKTVK